MVSPPPRAAAGPVASPSMSFERLWGWLALALPALGGLLAPISMVDLAYQLRAGHQILGSGRIPAVDTWTSTVAGAPWLDQQWGAQVVLSAVAGLAGWPGLPILRALLIAVAFAAIAAACRERGAGHRAAAMLGLLAFLLASPALALRPQLFGILLFALTLWLLAGRRRAPRRTWAVPALALLWANAHGSFVLAPALVGWALAEDVLDRQPAAARRSAALLVLTAAATCVTPFGPGVWQYAVVLSGNPELASRVSEWRPPTLGDPVGIAFLVSLLVVVLFVIVARRHGKRASLPTLGLLAGLAILGLRAVRGIAWWPLGAVVAIAPLLPGRAAGPAESAPRPTPPRIARLNRVVAGITTLAVALLALSWLPADPFAPGSPRFTSAPAGVAAAIAAEPAGMRVFHPQTWGSWLSYAAPDALVFADSRIELFPAAVWADYDVIATGAPGWDVVLADRSIDLVAVAPRDTTFAARLRAAGWSETYAGPDGWVFRSAGGGA